MKLTRHVVDELSAYLDGEVQDPDRIARHLATCPACARHHLELQLLSGQLKALRGPEAHPAFVARVMAHTAEVQADRGWFPRLAPQLAAALCVTVLTIAGLWRWLPHPSDAPAPGTEYPRVNVAWQDDAKVVEALSRLMDSGARVDLFGDLDEPVEMDEADIGLDSVLESLAEASIGAEVVDPFAQDDMSDFLDVSGEDEPLLLNDLHEAGENEV